MLKRYLSLATAVAFSLGMSAQTHASEMTSAYQQYQQAVSTGNTTQAFKYALQALNAGKQEYAAESDNLFALQYNYAVAAGQVGKYDIAVDQFETLADLAAQQGNMAVAEAVQVLAFDKHLPLGGALKHHDQLQQGGLARPGVTGQKRQLPGRKREAHLDLVRAAVGHAVAVHLHAADDA